MIDQVHLSAEWAVDADQVAVTFRVSNNSTQPVYAIDGTFCPSPGGVVNWSDRLTVDFRPPATAVLGSRLTPLNPSVHSVFPPVAFAVRLDVGEEHRSTLAASLPLIPDGMTTQPVPSVVLIAGKPIVRPYAGAPPQLADHSLTCRTAVFELGVIPHDESLDPRPARLDDRDLVRLQKAAWSLQRVLIAVLEPAEIPMLIPAELAENSRSRRQ
jgi:hypothetical protein